MCARSLSTRKITRDLRELYGIDISSNLMPTVTEAVLVEVAAEQTQSLDQAYPLVFFDAIQVRSAMKT